jgi:hypothetical protein
MSSDRTLLDARYTLRTWAVEANEQWKRAECAVAALLGEDSCAADALRACASVAASEWARAESAIIALEAAEAAHVEAQKAYEAQK